MLPRSLREAPNFQGKIGTFQIHFATSHLFEIFKKSSLYQMFCKLFYDFILWFVCYRCNVSFERQMLGYLYVLFLVTMVLVLSFKAKGVRENYREAMYIGLTMGFTVCIFLVWILGGFIAPNEYQVGT